MTKPENELTIQDFPGGWHRQGNQIWSDGWMEKCIKMAKDYEEEYEKNN